MQVNNELLKNLSEQIQDDIICCMESYLGSWSLDEIQYFDKVTSQLCQIVADRLDEYKQELY
jgi:hypothetical protein